MKDFLFVEKYRPKTIKEIVLPDKTKKLFLSFVKNKNIPNLLLIGKAGVGKTTVAKAMLDELDCDYMIINGSMNGNIDTLRNDIQQFASSVSFRDGRKYVILDEADYLNANSTQPALRNFMETYSKNCGFILTANYQSKIIEPLQSRCTVIDFAIPKEEKGKLAKEIYDATILILEKEGITYDVEAIKQLIIKFFPDFRRMLNEIQTHASSGHIGSAILSSLEDENFKKLIGFLKEKNFSSVRKWVGQSDMDHSTLFRKFYDSAADYFKPQSVPQLVLHAAKYQYQSAFSVDQEINTTAFLTEVMVDGVFL